jgi:glycosyltransferase involved in cell wall biosynthesis
MKILAIIDSLDSGGAERSLVDTLAAQPSDVRAELAVFRRSSDGIEADAKAAGIAIRHIRGNVAQRIRNVRQLVRSTAPDVVHSSLWNADLATRLALVGTDVPLVCSLVNDTYDDRRIHSYASRRRAAVRMIRALDRLTARRVDHFHAVTYSVKDHYARSLGIDREKISVARRGRDANRFRPPTRGERTDARKALGVEGQVVMAVGRLEPQKSFVTLVDAIELASASVPDVTAVIIGRNGSDGDRVRSRIEERRLAERVRWIGHRPDIDRLLRAADCFALSSQYEGTAGVIIEAMLAGVAVVASDLPGVREVSLDGSLATLVPVGDAVALAAGIVGALNAPSAQTSGRARSHAREQYSTEAAARGLRAIYQAAIDSRRPL